MGEGDHGAIDSRSDAINRMSSVLSSRKNWSGSTSCSRWWTPEGKGDVIADKATLAATIPVARASSGNGAFEERRWAIRAIAPVVSAESKES